MKLFEGLKKEFYDFPDIKKAQNGVYIKGFNSPNTQNYFRYLGYKEHFNEPIACVVLRFDYSGWCYGVGYVFLIDSDNLVLFTGAYLVRDCLFE